MATSFGNIMMGAAMRIVLLWEVIFAQLTFQHQQRMDADYLLSKIVLAMHYLLSYSFRLKIYMLSISDIFKEI